MFKKKFKMSYTHIYFDSELKNNNDTSNNPVIRMGHISCSYGKFIIVWGGVHKVYIVIFIHFKILDIGKFNLRFISIKFKINKINLNKYLAFSF